jgi:ADP-L-glycero-D-manno-heptose 6-epimerase
MYLITGGAGFIGSNVVAALSERGSAVVICDRLREGEKWRNLAKSELHDIVAPDALEHWLQSYGSRVEAIIHLGAISSTSEPNVDLIVASNYCLSCYLWRWCAAHNKRLVYAS